MTLEISIASFGDLLRKESFSPASVQREFQWESGEASRLHLDLLAFMRSHGFDPSPGDESFEGPSFDDDGEDAPHATSEAPDPPDGGDAAVAARTAAARRRARQTPKAPRSDAYFMGQIVLSPAPRATDTFYIYDGYQRMTTAMMLFSALRGQAADPKLIERLSHLMGSNAPKRRLVARTEAGTLARLIGPVAGAANVGLRSGWSQVDKRLLDVRDTFASRVKQWGDADIAQFLNLLLSKVYVSIALTPNRSTAYQIFVGANARGRQLFVSDVVKGKIIEVIDRGDGPVVAERYAKEWSKQQRLMRKSFDDLLAASEFLRYLPTEAHSPGELLMQEIDSAEEQENFDVKALSDDLKEWVDDTLKVHVDAQERLRRHLSMKTLKGGDLTLRRLSFLDWDDWRPVALQIHLQHHDDWRARARALTALYRTCFVFDLVDWSEAGRRLQMAKAVDQLQTGVDVIKGCVAADGSTVFGALSSSRKNRAKAFERLSGPLTVAEKRGPIVRVLETLEWRDGVPSDCTDDADVEHVLPRARKDDWAAAFTPEEHEFWHNRLGNLCLLDKGANFELQTAPWREKRPVYLEWEWKFKTAGDVAGAQSWAVADIQERHDRAVEKVARSLQIWPLKA